MPFKKGTSGNPIGRPKGSVSTTTKLIREHISQAIDGNKIMEMLDKIDSPTEYINAISKLLPYSIGKVKAYEDVEEIEPIDININHENALYDLAYCLNLTGELKNSIHYYKKFIDEDPYSEFGWFNLGNIYNKLKWYIL